MFLYMIFFLLLFSLDSDSKVLDVCHTWMELDERAIWRNIHICSWNWFQYMYIPIEWARYLICYWMITNHHRHHHSCGNFFFFRVFSFFLSSCHFLLYSFTCSRPNGTLIFMYIYLPIYLYSPCNVCICGASDFI